MGLRCPQYKSRYKKSRSKKKRGKFPSTRKVHLGGYKKFGMKRLTQV